MCLDISSKVSEMESRVRVTVLGKEPFQRWWPSCARTLPAREENRVYQSRRLQRVWASGPLHSYGHDRMIGQMETSDDGFPHNGPRVARGGGEEVEEEAEGET